MLLGVSLEAEKGEGCASNRNNNKMRAQIPQYCGLLRELQRPRVGTRGRRRENRLQQALCVALRTFLLLLLQSCDRGDIIKSLLFSRPLRCHVQVGLGVLEQGYREGTLA